MCRHACIPGFVNNLFLFQSLSTMRCYGPCRRRRRRRRRRRPASRARLARRRRAMRLRSITHARTHARTHAHGARGHHHHHLYCYNTKGALHRRCYMFACRRNSSARCWYPTCVLSPNCAHVNRPLPLASRRRFAASSLSINAVSPFTPGDMRATRDMPTAFHARAICKPQNPNLK